MTKRIVAVTGEYTNQQGEQKAEFTQIGILGVSQNGKEYILLDPSVSISGVLAKQNALAFKRGEPMRDAVMCSVFENESQPTSPGGWGQPQQLGGNAGAPSGGQGYGNTQQGYGSQRR